MRELEQKLGQALVDDPGLTIIRLNGTGPFVAQAGGGGAGGNAESRTTVLEGPAAALQAGKIPTDNNRVSISTITPSP